MECPDVEDHNLSISLPAHPPEVNVDPFTGVKTNRY